MAEPNDRYQRAKQTMIERYFGTEEAYREFMRQKGKKGGIKSRGGGFGTTKPNKNGLTGREQAKLAGAIGGKAPKPRGKHVQ